MKKVTYIAYKDLNDGKMFFNPAPSTYGRKDPVIGDNYGNAITTKIGSLDEVVEFCDSYNAKLEKSLFA